GVEDPDLLPRLRQRDREVRGQGRLADAALAAADGHDAGRGLERQSLAAPFEAGAQLRRQRLPLLRRHDVEVERDALHTRDITQHLGDLLLERVAQRTAGDGQRDRDADVAALDLDAADHVELGDRALQLRVDDTLERAEDLVAIGLAHAFETTRSNLA